jgi:hypothetical protein
MQKYLDETFKNLGIAIDISTPAKATCVDGSYDKAIPSSAAFIKGLTPSFCGEWSLKTSEKLEKKLTAKDVKAASKRRWQLSKRTPPPRPLTSDQYPGWAVTFDWQPDQMTDDCSKEDYCTTAMSDLLSTCNG